VCRWLRCIACSAACAAAFQQRFLVLFQRLAVQDCVVCTVSATLGRQRGSELVAKGGIEPPTRGFSTTLKHRISALVQQLTQPFSAA
jgi:hypothetical protein